MPIVELAVALASMKSVIDIAKEYVSLRGAIKDESKLAGMQSTVIAAQSAMLELQELHSALMTEKDHLKNRVTQLEAWDEEKRSYKLVSLAPGVFAYAYAPETELTHPPHYLCTNCYGDNKKSILSLKSHKPPVYRCPGCRTEFPLPPQPFRQGHLSR